MKGVIITADDFGYSKARNKGIIETFMNGVVTSTSLLINAIECQDALQQAESCGIPVENIGLHLNLSEGKPLSPINNVNEIQSLVDKDGYFLGKNGFHKADSQGKLNLEEVKIEIRSQIGKYKDLTGRLPPYIDGHQHIHVTGICESFCKVLNEYGIKFTRQCSEINIHQHLYIDEARRNFYILKCQQAEMAKEIFKRHGIWCSDGFIGLSTMGSDMTIERIQTAILSTFKQQHTKGAQYICEIMVHPGYRTTHNGGCGTGPDDFSQSPDREHELNILKDDSLKQFFIDHNVKLMSYSDIAKL